MKREAPRDRSGFPRLLIIVTIVLVLAAYAIYSNTSIGQVTVAGSIRDAVGGLVAQVTVEGTVVDASVGAPLANVRVAAREKASGKPAQVLSTAADGAYAFGKIERGSLLLFEVDGYEPQEIEFSSSQTRNVELKPVLVSGKIRDSYTNSPILEASVSLADVMATTDVDGNYQIRRAKKGNPLLVKAEGYAPAEAPFTGQPNLDISLRPNTLTGTIKDAATGAPIKDAHISVAGKEGKSNETGSYRLTDLPLGPLKLAATAPGYEKLSLDLKETARQDIALKQFVVKALYLTYYGIADEGLRSNALEKVDRTEVNGIVIDVKGDRGWTVYKSDVALAKQIGAADNPTVRDFDSLMATLKKKNIYTIARIVVFKDNPLAMSRPDLAIIDTKTGKPWIDRENLAWVDPNREEVWEYNLALAKEAARKGFDEIQFDYIRFPTDGSVSTARYARQNTMENRLEAINGFLATAKSELKPLGVAISIDVFGYTCWREDDMGIGQRIEDIAQYVDYISPMVYPSTYSDGIPDYRNAVAYPYEIVYYSLKRANERLSGMPAKIRPWLQYFDDYPWATGMQYNAREIEAQKKAVVDAKTHGWMMWDPTNKYARGGLTVE